MFRFFAVVGFSYFVTLILANFIPIKFTFLAISLSAIAFILILIIKKCRKYKVLLLSFFTVFIGLSIYTINFYFNIKPVYDLGEKDITVSGKIVELPHKTVDGKYKYTFKIDNIVGIDKPRNFKISLFSTNPIEADIYDSFTGSVHISHPENTPEFSVEDFYRTKSIYAQGFLYDYKPNHTESITNFKPFYYYVLKARRALISTVNILFPKKQASVVNGILFGDKGNIDNDVKMNFDRIGVYHLLAISGVHVTILSRLLIIFLKRMKINMRLSNIISVCAVLIFMAITCFTPSIVRAGVMLILYLLGEIIFRNSDEINSLGVSVLLVTLFNIDLAGDIGFWLSFLSTFGIIVLEPRLRTWLENKLNIPKYANSLWNYMIDSVLITVSSCAFTMPVVFLYYKKLSVISLISNILLIFPVSIMLGSAMILIFLYLMSFPIFIFMPFKILCGCTVNYIIWCASALSYIPFATVSVDYLFVKIWISISLALMGIAFFCGDTRKNIRLLPLISLNLFIIGLLINKILMHDVTRLAVLNLGEGCAIVLSQNGQNSLILYGDEKSNKQKIIEYLYRINVYKIDYLIIPSYISDDVKFINNIKELYRPNVTLLRKYQDIEIGILETNNVISFESNFDSLIWNDINLVSREINGYNLSYLTLYGKNVLICPYGGEFDDNLGNWSKCDVLVAGGVPSNYNKINSTYNVFSMNKRDSEIILPKFSHMQDRVFSTALYGTINIDIKKTGELLVGRKI